MAGLVTQELWRALVGVELYIQRGIVDQIQACSGSFGGEDMKPVHDAYRLFREQAPQLSETVQAAVETCLETAETGLNACLNVLRDHANGTLARAEATKAFDRERERTLTNYRNCMQQLEHQSSGESPSGTIREDAGRVLHALAEFATGPGDQRRGRHNLPGKTIAQALETLQKCTMTPERISDAVHVLERSGYVRVTRALGTAPYSFRGIELTPTGRLEYQESKERQGEQFSTELTRAPGGADGRTGRRIFLGHGRSDAWRELKDFLADRLKLDWDEFNREATAGLSTKERLECMLDASRFAFLILTAEDERADGARTARANVVHEVGLFQGRLGFNRAIVLLEEGCEEFSNIVGITQLRFPRNHIKATFEEVRRVLERESILAK